LSCRSCLVILSRIERWKKVRNIPLLDFFDPLLIEFLVVSERFVQLPKPTIVWGTSFERHNCENWLDWICQLLLISHHLLESSFIRRNNLYRLICIVHHFNSQTFRV
jgi:hypothetical protein